MQFQFISESEGMAQRKEISSNNAVNDYFDELEK